ncbi:MAG: DUF2478 domain-containing protein [Rhodocyclaceae bacterium]|nr:DUF2478 domain-containing protein [Rhodocyclaceae bacterium]
MPAPRLAAILQPPVHSRADAVLLAFLQELQTQGHTVRGLVQQERAQAHDPVILHDLATGRRFTISQSLGAGSTACNLNPHMLAEASAVLRTALAELPPPALIVLNRFGPQEAEGHGLRQELADTLAHGIPLLTILNPRWLPHWRQFSDGMACELIPTLDALRQWWQSEA